LPKLIEEMEKAKEESKEEAEEFDKPKFGSGEVKDLGTLGGKSSKSKKRSRPQPQDEDQIDKELSPSKKGVTPTKAKNGHSIKKAKISDQEQTD
jgi:hypothetical protein